METLNKLISGAPKTAEELRAIVKPFQEAEQKKRADAEMEAGIPKKDYIEKKVREGIADLERDILREDKYSYNEYSLITCEIQQCYFIRQRLREMGYRVGRLNHQQGTEFRFPLSL